MLIKSISWFINSGIGIFLLSLHSVINRPNGKEEGIIRITGNYPLFVRVRDFQHQPIFTTGDTGKGERDQDIHATIWLYQ